MPSKAEFVEMMRARTKSISLRIINEFDKNEVKESLRVIRNQLLRSATSVGANYRAACRSRSNREFYSKLSITIEEADETIILVGIVGGVKARAGGSY